MKNYISIILALVLFVSLVAACGDSGKINNSSETNGSAITNDIAEAGKMRPQLTVPKIDYGGYQFRILSINSTVTGNSTSPGGYYYSEYTYIPEMAGEPINDAIYERNLKISEEYNVEIIDKEVPDVFSEARKIIASGEDVYDVITPFIDMSFNLAQQKYIYNLNNIPYLDLKNEWWDQVLIEKLSLNNKLFTITGDISMEDEEMNWLLIINKVLMEQHNLTNLYDIVRDGKWTYDYVHGLGASVTHDINGDGVTDWEDVYAFGNGYYGGQFFYFASGENVAVLDKDGYPQLTIGRERSISVMDKVTAFFNDFNFILWADFTTSSGVAGGVYFRTMFKENRLLIFMTNIYAIKELRGMVDDFAIVPGPKYEEKQDNYYMIVSTHACRGICIPVTNTELERTGILLEAIAYYSKIVQEAHLDVTVTGKFIRDEESRDMLELIFNSRNYDIGKAFGWGEYIGQIAEAVRYNKGFAPLVEANKTRAETEIEKSYKIFTEIDT